MTPVDLHHRIKLEDFDVTKSPDQWTARVALAWRPGEEFVGTAQAEHTPLGEVRCAAEATARALELASDGRIVLDVLAVKIVEGFDTVIVVVALTSRVDELQERLSGSCLVRGEPSRGAVRAVLDATNRLLGKVMGGK